MTLYALDGVAPVVHPTAWVHPDATVIGRVELGPEVSIWPQAVLRGDYGDTRVAPGRRSRTAPAPPTSSSRRWRCSCRTPAATAPA